MPGYVMHLAEARRIVDALRKKYVLSDTWEQAFMTGTLLPDTRIRGDKCYSHFWDPEHLGELALGPDLDLFLAKYGDTLHNPLMLGYYAHLHLDSGYVSRFWPTAIAFYDAQGKTEIMRGKITEVEMLTHHKRVPVGDFFSPAYYYGEYSKLNGYYIDTYHLAKPDWEHIAPYDGEFAMDEVRLSDMGWVCTELEHLLSRCHAGDESRLQVFDLNQLEAFIAWSAEQFLEICERDRLI